MRFGLFIWCLEGIPIFLLRKNGLDIGSGSKHKQMLWLKSSQCCRFSDMLQLSFHHLDLKLSRSSSRYVRTFSLLDPFSSFCTGLWFVHFWRLFMVLVSNYNPTPDKYIHHCWLFCPYYYFYSQIIAWKPVGVSPVMAEAHHWVSVSMFILLALWAIPLPWAKRSIWTKKPAQFGWLSNFWWLSCKCRSSIFKYAHFSPCKLG